MRFEALHPKNVGWAFKPKYERLLRGPLSTSQTNFNTNSTVSPSPSSPSSPSSAYLRQRRQLSKFYNFPASPAHRHSQVVASSYQSLIFISHKLIVAFSDWRRHTRYVQYSAMTHCFSPRPPRMSSLIVIHLSCFRVPTSLGHPCSSPF